MKTVLDSVKASMEQVKKDRRQAMTDISDSHRWLAERAKKLDVQFKNLEEIDKRQAELQEFMDKSKGEAKKEEW